MSLSMEEMQKLLSSKKHREYTAKTESWINDRELKFIAAEVKNGAKVIMLRNKEYTITHDPKWDEILIRPVVGFVPLARIPMDTIKKA
jgi:hypothetical protein